jgi:ion channel POLLUX/CASTOR
VLPPEKDNPDSYVIKTILAIVNNPNRRPQPYHIVTQIESEHNLDVVSMIGVADEVQTILIGDQIARIVAQTSRQSGLSVVYTELLNFTGSEIYFQSEPQLTGMTYREALMAYDDSCVIGMNFAAGGLALNPLMDTRISARDKIIVISQDDDRVNLSGLPGVPLSPESILPGPSIQSLTPEKGLILGWNSKAPVIIKELENYVAPGSELLVVSEQEISEDIKTACTKCQNQRVTFRFGDASDRRVLDQLDVASFQHIIVLAYEKMDEQSADAETMVTLLHLRYITEKLGRRSDIVSEMLDLRNRRLAEVAKVDDFIVSDHLISLMLAQFSENGALSHVFSELFDAVGPELYFKPVNDYIDVSQPVTFYTLVEAACRRGETAVGYRIQSEMNDAARSYGVYTNPKKSALVSFSADDKVLVLAEHEVKSP